MINLHTKNVTVFFLQVRNFYKKLYFNPGLEVGREEWLHRPSLLMVGQEVEVGDSLERKRSVSVSYTHHR